MIPYRIIMILPCLALFFPLLTAVGEAMPEFRVKTAFIYNFIAFTEWPDPSLDDAELNLCIYGRTPLSNEIEKLRGKRVNERYINTYKEVESNNLDICQIIFIASSSISHLPRILEKLKEKPILTIADSPGAGRQGVALNMGVTEKKIVFEANLSITQQAGLTISSKLLRLATEVYQ